MPYSIKTKDGIQINNIPDDVPKDSDTLRQRVAAARAHREQQQQPQIDVAALQAQRQQAQPQPLASSGTSRSWEAAPEPDPIAAKQAERIAAIPEITGSMKKLSENVGFLQGVAGLTAFDPDEFGQILTAADPAIGVVTTPEGERIAVNNQTGAAFSINKVGPSLMDAVQFGGAVAAFSPASRAASIPMQGLAGAGTQAVIEGGQKLAGGDVNVGDVAMAGAAPVVMAGAVNAVKSIPGTAKAAAKYLDDFMSGKPMRPSIKGAEAMTPQQLAGAADVAESAKRSAIREAIKEQSVESVGWNVDRKGNIVADSLQRDLIRKGVNDKAVMVLRDLNAGDKDAAGRMLDLAENYIKSVKGSERARPQMVIGENAMRRFDVIKKAQQEASKKIGAAVDDDLKGKPVDISSEVDEFLDSMESLGVNVFGKSGPDFKQSMITGSNVTPVRNVLNRVKNSYDDASELHQLKQFITNQLDYDNPASKPLDRQAENALKSLRAGINTKLRGMSDNYASANDDFRAAAEAVNPFAKIMGRRFDPEASRVDNYVGQELRKVLTNYQSSNDMITAIDDLDVVARKFGGKFDDNLMNQIVLNSELERIFGTFAPGSAQGVGEKAIEVGLDRALGATGQAVKAVGAAAKDRLVFTPQSKEKLDLIRELKTMVTRSHL